MHSKIQINKIVKGIYQGGVLTQWWGHSLSINVTRDQFANPRSHVSGVCWFSTQLQTPCTQGTRHSSYSYIEHVLKDLCRFQHAHYLSLCHYFFSAAFVQFCTEVQGDVQTRCMSPPCTSPYTHKRQPQCCELHALCHSLQHFLDVSYTIPFFIVLLLLGYL